MAAIESIFQEYAERLNRRLPGENMAKFSSPGHSSSQLLSLPAGFEHLGVSSDVNITILHQIGDAFTGDLAAILLVRISPKSVFPASTATAVIEFRRHVFCQIQGTNISNILVIDDVDALRNSESQAVRPPSWSAKAPPSGFCLAEAYRAYFNCVSTRTMEENLSKFTNDQITFNGHSVTREQYREAMEECHDVMANCKNTLEKLIVDEEKQQLAARVVFEWTPVKAWNGIEPTGRRVKFTEHVFVWFDEVEVQTLGFEHDLKTCHLAFAVELGSVGLSTGGRFGTSTEPLLLSRTVSEHLSVQRWSLISEQDLIGKVAIVTGASRGIGRGIAVHLASRGANIIGTCSVLSSLCKIDDLRAEIKGVVAPLLEPREYRNAIVNAVKEYGSLNILVQNAAVVEVAPVGMITQDHINRLLTANIEAPVFLVQALLPYFQPESRIINVSSEGGRDPSPVAPYLQLVFWF
ncbi:3-oxoacyl-(acyl-carrier-protein) reductase [Colletotrichum simmondsii]|uniref:3-oxoacyl-[acyl-carrier-protein] reductase n=1 Tax=Colletotrichum simmondsii TaxID=703756 RepID=A0A135SM42_9PEZI|nr:3-oxoacyl-(acyl-carrier-protein) reductase [Colletotrichum simmondsii]